MINLVTNYFYSVATEKDTFPTYLIAIIYDEDDVYLY
jgi:hypothetical protein